MTLIKIALKPTIITNDIDYLKIQYINIETISKYNDIDYVIIDNESIGLLDYFVNNDINVIICIIINKKTDFDAKKLKNCVDKLKRKKQKMFLINSASTYENF